jgi:nucleoid-associated protein YejK
MERAAQYWSTFLRDAKKDSEAAAADAVIEVLHVDKSAVIRDAATFHGNMVNDLAATLTDEGIAAFEKKLTEEIQEEIERYPESDYGCVVRTDYQPEGILMDALAAGGMSQPCYGFFFPFKTMMRIKKDGTFTIQRG